MGLLEVKDLKKSFLSPAGKMEMILHVPKFSLEGRAQVALEGASGSGKTTFLHLLAGVLPADSGKITMDGHSLHLLREAARDQLRAQEIGYVFQSFNLLSGFSCLENLTLSMNLAGQSDLEHAHALLHAVGLQDRRNHRPHQLSIGQQQRVAIARALVNKPKLVLADEPTGNLDPANTDRSLSLLRSLCEEWESSLILVSHDTRVIRQFERNIRWEELNQIKRDEKNFHTQEGSA
jgi:ABC-type lipoprotein export system ATPase subunit